MATFNSVLESQARYCAKSGITVSVDRRHDWVTITDESGADIFLQGDDGAQFIAQADALENQYNEEPHHNILLVVAYPYADLLAETPAPEKKAPFVAGYNMAGYMPDSEPAEFDTFDEAKRYIIWTIKNTFEEMAEDEETAETFCALAEEINLQSGEFSVTCNGYAFWVSKS